ncbi:hypothetical protein ACFVW9_39420 [Streptomyces sp. NPDC058217]|uniref:hypothetical protein n=1 Tax=Streptomyces sp. NPDC058217 TaxID=3346384 RepID=UPI0036F08CE1
MPERLHAQGLTTVRASPAGFLRDLQDLYHRTVPFQEEAQRFRLGGTCERRVNALLAAGAALWH